MKIAPYVFTALFVAGCTSAVADQPVPSLPADYAALPVADAAPECAAEAWARLAAARQKRIADLEDYANAGQFPTNVWKPMPTPCFVGANGVYCAVGQLMVQSGQQELADRIAAADNFIVLADHPTSPADDWISASGLTFEECALIQPSYDHMRPPIDEYPPERPVLRHDSRVSDQLIQSRLLAVVRKLKQDTPQSLALALQRGFKPAAGQGYTLADGNLPLLVENPQSLPMLVRVSTPGAVPGPWRILAPGRCCRVSGPGLVEVAPQLTRFAGQTGV